MGIAEPARKEQAARRSRVWLQRVEQVGPAEESLERERSVAGQERIHRVVATVQAQPRHGRGASRRNLRANKAIPR